MKRRDGEAESAFVSEENETKNETDNIDLPSHFPLNLLLSVDPDIFIHCYLSSFNAESCLSFHSLVLLLLFLPEITVA